MEPNEIVTEARARIIWGEPASFVRDSLISKGYSENEADAQIREFCAERNAEIRRIGVRDIVIGGALVLVASLIFYFCFGNLHFGLTVTHIFGKFLGIVAVGLVYGLWKLVTGVFYLVRPQSEEESITEISE
jgi:hypothetical protein